MKISAGDPARRAPVPSAMSLPPESPSERQAPIRAARLLLAAPLLFAALLAACIGPGARGSFDRTLTVSGPTQLYLTNGSGNIRIQAGAPGQVRVHGDFTVGNWPFANPRRRVAEIEQNPPIRQEGSLIRIGYPGYRSHNVGIDYVIEVPADTEVHASSGSGDCRVENVAGPVTVTSGSGNLHALGIQGDLHVTDGSGDVRVNEVKGSASVTDGSGEVVLHTIGGRVRVLNGSGDITLTDPAGPASLHTGSGNVRVSGASADLRVRDGSGDAIVSGSPASGAYWELHTGSGNVTLGVPADASFRLDATTHFGSIHSSIPLTIVQQDRHELHAVVGQGAARVGVETGSGDIRVHASSH